MRKQLTEEEVLDRVCIIHFCEGKIMKLLQGEIHILIYELYLKELSLKLGK